MAGKHRKSKTCPFMWHKKSFIHDNHFCCLENGHTGQHLCGKWECAERA